MSLPTVETLSLTWREWLQDGKRLTTREFMRAVSTAKLWHRRVRSRRHLARLDSRLLQDIGITRTQAQIEARKLFWQA